MRLGRLADGRTVALLPSEETMVDLGGSLAAYRRGDPNGASLLASAIGKDGSDPWITLIERWDELRDVVTRIIEAAEQGDGFATLAVSDATFGAPLPSPSSRVFALGGNFTKHIVDASRVVFGEDSDAYRALLRRKEQGPWGFLTIPDTIVGHGAIIRPPSGLSKIDYEGEVAVILGRAGRSVTADDVTVWGYTAWNDFSLRDAALGVGPTYDAGPMAWTLQKNFDTGSSAGPWVVVDYEQTYAIDALPIELRVNGEIRQRGATDEMIFTFGETVEHLSHFLTLRPGDVIASGTPAGTALESGIDGPFLRDGDVTEVTVPGVGVLRNTISLEHDTEAEARLVIAGRERA